jgi:hypothetical protein
MPEKPFTAPPESPELEHGFDEVDALDKCLYNAAKHIRRALGDPVLPQGNAALISMAFRRSELEALNMLLTFMEVPNPPEEEYLPIDWNAAYRN